MSNQIVSALLSLLLVLGIFLSAVTVFADATEPTMQNEAQEKEEILRIGKEADMFAYILCEMFYSVSIHEDRENLLNEFDSEFKEFGVKKGYMNETVGEKIEVSVELLNGEKITREYYPYADSMNSYEAWEKEVKTYFLTDFLQLVAPNAFNQQKQFTSRTKLIELNGKTYGTYVTGNGRDFYIDWNTAKFIDFTDKSATVRVNMYNSYYDPEVQRYVTFAKTPEGWRVSGGDAFYISFPSYPELRPSKFKETELLTRFLTGIPYTQIESKTGTDKEKLIAEYEEEYAPLIEKGYVSFENVRLAKTPTEKDSFLYFELPENMNTKDDWEKALGEYFLEDSLGLLDRLVYKDGKWVLSANRTAEVLTPVWDTFQYGNAEPGQEIVIVDANDDTGNVSDKHKGLNFEFIMTEKGWLLKDSTYLRALLSANPPETGDSTAPYFALSALSFLSLALAGAAVARKRKKLLL